MHISICAVGCRYTAFDYPVGILYSSVSKRIQLWLASYVIERTHANSGHGSLTHSQLVPYMIKSIHYTTTNVSR